MAKKTIRIFLWVTVFAVAMAFLETAVVVYLRKLYYPDGFNFPLKLIGPDIALTEFLREIATLIMLIAVGIFAGRNHTERFAWFIYTFGIWDIFYYVFLVALLDWPSSLLTWDLLFLVPVTWVGPVLGPIINSLMMIALALMIIFFTEKKTRAKIGKWVWILLISGSLIVIVSYTEEYTRYMLQQFSLIEITGFSSTEQVITYAGTFIPRHFEWWIYAIGAGMHFAGIFLVWKRNQ